MIDRLDRVALQSTETTVAPDWLARGRGRGPMKRKLRSRSGTRRGSPRKGPEPVAEVGKNHGGGSASDSSWSDSDTPAEIKSVTQLRKLVELKIKSKGLSQAEEVAAELKQSRIYKSTIRAFRNGRPISKERFSKVCTAFANWIGRELSGAAKAEISVYSTEKSARPDINVSDMKALRSGKHSSEGSIEDVERGTPKRRVRARAIAPAEADAKAEAHTEDRAQPQARRARARAVARKDREDVKARQATSATAAFEREIAINVEETGEGIVGDGRKGDDGVLVDEMLGQEDPSNSIARSTSGAKCFWPGQFFSIF